MSQSVTRLDSVARLLSRFRTSLLLVVFWLLIIPVAGYLSSMLYSLANNDASSYLPRSAESTRVFSILAHQNRPQPINATVIYVHETGNRGRDRHYCQPPAQIPACATNALGSYLG